MLKSLADRYSKALFQAAENANSLEAVNLDMTQIASLFLESSELANLLIRADRVPSAIQGIAKNLGQQIQASQLSCRLLEILALRQRLSLLPGIAAAFLCEVKSKQGITQAKVTSIRELDSNEQKRITTSLTQLTGNLIEIEWLQDLSILGGIYIQIGDKIIDGTLRSRIQQLRKHLTQG